MANCHSCQFKKSIPGNAHISCGHPEINHRGINLLIFGQVLVGNGNILKDHLGFTFNPRGVQSGWCNFPMEYDPIWLEGDCNLIQTVEVKDNAPETEIQTEPAIA